MHTAHSDQLVKPVLHYWPLQVAQNNHNIPAPIPAALVTRHQLRGSEYKHTEWIVCFYSRSSFYIADKDVL